jgi:hypothetical protein
VRQDFRLLEGAVVTGRVLDKLTGQGVRATVRTAPLAGNKFLAAKPEYGLNSRDRPFCQTDSDGRFRLVTVPGATLVLASTFDHQAWYGQPYSSYRLAGPDPDHKDLFQLRSGNYEIAAAGSRLIESLFQQNAAKVLDVKEAGETAVDFVLDPGLTGRIALQDPDGRPLAGTWISGLTEDLLQPYRTTESVVRVFCLDPAKPRTLTIYHPGRKLGGTVTVHGDEQEPVPAKLSPLGRITGRLVDKNGKPLAGVDALATTLDLRIFYLYRSAGHESGVSRSDKDGRFTCDALFPGTPFQVLFEKGGQPYPPDASQRKYNLQSGEVLDLGDLKLTADP